MLGLTVTHIKALKEFQKFQEMSDEDRKVLRFGIVPALVDEVLKVHCLLRMEQRYKEPSIL